MKKLNYFIIAVSAMFVVTSCSEKYLDTDNLFAVSLDNFYSNPDDIDEAMSGVYNALYTIGIHSEEVMAANLMSDLMLAGGGPDDKSAKFVDNFTDPQEDTYRDLWVQSYNGISRANAIIEKVVDKDFSQFFDTPELAEAFKDEAIGEALFMRAFLYFRLAKFFGGVPMIVKIDDPRDAPRASYSDTYAQITTDLLAAIDLMGDTPFPAVSGDRYGHANKWVAEAYLARVYLYYTGYMTNMEGQATSTLPLVDGGTLSKSEVLSHLNDCISNSGYRLASDFRNIWPYSYVNQSAASTVLPWADNENLEWIGQDGVSPTFGTGNYESMFVQRFSFADFGWTGPTGFQATTNKFCLYSAVRENSMTPFGQGWGWCPVVPSLWNSWDDADPRKEGSILELGNAEQGTNSWQPDQGDHETGLVNKKYINLQHGGSSGVQGMFVQMYGWGNNDFQIYNAQDFIYMRFADVLLMHSEISETADGMNQVRARAGGLGPVGYSLEALKEERLHELAFEGLRWFDIVRWGDVDTAFNYTVNVRNSGVDATYTASYRTQTKGLVSIPETEVRLSNNVYEQNPGWE